MGGRGVVVVVLGPVGLCAWVYEWVHFGAHTERVEVARLRMWSSVMRGAVWVSGGRFLMSLMIFLCVLMSGWRYVLVLSFDPQMEIPLMRCG